MRHPYLKMTVQYFRRAEHGIACVCNFLQALWHSKATIAASHACHHPPRAGWVCEDLAGVSPDLGHCRSHPHGTTAPVRDHGPRIASWMGLLTPHLILGSALDTTSKSGFGTMARIPHWILKVAQDSVRDHGSLIIPRIGLGDRPEVSDIPHRIPNENVLPTRRGRDTAI